MTNSLDDEQLLNFSVPFDPVLFDKIVTSTKSNDSQAVILLSKYKNSPDNYQHIESILNQCQLIESHLIGLNILENLIKTRYFVYDANIRSNFESFLFNFVKNRAETKDVLLNKFNQVFVQLIISNHYVKTSNSFISDLIEHCQSTTINQAINLFSILRLLVEEIIINDSPRTLKVKCIANLKSDLLSILNFSNMVLEKAQGMDSKLIENNLVFLTVFFRLLKSHNEKNQDLKISISEKIIEQFTKNLISSLQSSHTTNILKTLIQIIGFSGLDTSEFASGFLLSDMKKEIAVQFKVFLEMYYSKFENSKTKFRRSYSTMSDAEKDFILQSAYLLSVLNDENLDQSDSPSSLKQIILLFASLPDLKIFKILLSCLPFEVTSFQLIINRFPRPQEVLVTELDGEIIREKITGTEAIDFSNQMCNWALKYMQTNPSSPDIIIDCLSRVDDSIDSTVYENDYIVDKRTQSQNTVFTFNYKLLNSLCWTVGSVAPHLHAPDDLFVTILKHLLMLCDHKHKKEEKAIIASAIMYIVGKHYKFLKGNRKFLRTVIDKLFEFCEETYIGIKDMACDTFFMICEKLTFEDFFIHSNIHFSREKDKKNYIIVVIETFKEKTKELLPYQQRVIIEGILLLLRNKRETIQLLSQQIDVTDPVHFMKSQSMIVQSYLRYTSEVKSDTSTYISASDDDSVFIDQISNYILENFSNQKSDFFEYFTVYFSNTPICNNSFFKLKQFYENFKTQENILEVINGYVASMNQNNICLDEQIVNFNSNNDVNIFLQFVITSFYPSAEHVNYDWLKLTQSAMNNYLLQSLQTDQRFLTTILLGLQSNIHNNTSCSIQLLGKIYKIVFEFNNIYFLNTYTDIIMENIIGMICDKDREYVFQELTVLLKKIIQVQIKMSNDDTKITKCCYNLLSQFDNLSDQYKEIVVKSITAINSQESFNDAMNDFRMYIWSYFDYDIENERELLNWRMREGN